MAHGTLLLHSAKAAIPGPCETSYSGIPSRQPILTRRALSIEVLRVIECLLAKLDL
jgi:hypothetical protein